MRKTKEFFKIIVVLVIVMAVAIFVTSKTNLVGLSSPKEEQSKEITRPGCLGLNYHRIRKRKVPKKIIETLTNSNELMYYSVYEDEFENHIQTLLDNDAVFLSSEEVRIHQRNNNFPENAVWLSIDDVDISVYENAYPILKKYNIPFTIFVIAGQVGSTDFENLTLANWEQIQEMVDSGLATVGSHTYDMHKLKDNQPVFFALEQKKAFSIDLIKSKETIESKLNNVEVVDFAYPYGEGKSDLVPIIQEAGFLNASLLYADTITVEDDPYWQNRLLVDEESFQEVVIPWLQK